MEIIWNICEGLSGTNDDDDERESFHCILPKYKQQTWSFAREFLKSPCEFGNITFKNSNTLPLVSFVHW